MVRVPAADRWPSGPDEQELLRLADAFGRRGESLPGAIDQQWLVFGGIDLRGKTVLDVGAGDGRASAYAAACGATRVVALEPEAAGGEAGSADAAERLHAELGYDRRITILRETLEAAALPEPFDVVLINAAINHLDEEACARLHEDPAARALYRPFLARLAASCRPGGRLIIVDCSRRNLFPAVGLPNPIMKTIAWRIHQTPELWAGLLAEAGFRKPRIEWLPLTRKYGLGPILSMRWVAHCLNSVFRLVMEKPGP